MIWRNCELSIGAQQYLPERKKDVAYRLSSWALHQERFLGPLLQFFIQDHQTTNISSYRLTRHDESGGSCRLPLTSISLEYNSLEVLGEVGHLPLEDPRVREHQPEIDVRERHSSALGPPSGAFGTSKRLASPSNHTRSTWLETSHHTVWPDFSLTTWSPVRSRWFWPLCG